MLAQIRLFGCRSALVYLHENELIEFQIANIQPVTSETEDENGEGLGWRKKEALWKEWVASLAPGAHVIIDFAGSGKRSTRALVLEKQAKSIKVRTLDTNYDLYLDIRCAVEQSLAVPWLE